MNKQLIPKGFFRKTQEQGLHKIVKPEANEIDLCHYGGKVRNKPNSWLALSTCDGLSGVIFDGKEMHYVEKMGNEHVLYKHSDLISERNKTCGFPDAETETKHNHNRILRVIIATFFLLYLLYYVFSINVPLSKTSW